MSHPTAADRRVAEARIALSHRLAEAVPCLTTREALVTLIEQYATLEAARMRGVVWRQALESQERIQRRQEIEAR